MNFESRCTFETKVQGKWRRRRGSERRCHCRQEFFIDGFLFDSGWNRVTLFRDTSQHA